MCGGCVFEAEESSIILCVEAEFAHHRNSVVVYVCLCIILVFSIIRGGTRVFSIRVVLYGLSVDLFEPIDNHS